MLVAPFLQSCLYSRIASFDEIMQTRSLHMTKLTGHAPFYCGSDEKYDYYMVTDVGSSKYKVPTTPHLFYPSTVPFTGWQRSQWHYFSVYRGRIVITSLKQREQLLGFISKTYRDIPMEQRTPRQQLAVLNDWCVKNWGHDRLRIPEVGDSNPKPEWRFLYKSNEKPYTPQEYGFFQPSADPRF